MVCAVITLLSVSGLSTQRLAGRIRPVKLFHPAALHFANNEKILYLRKICWLGRMEHIPKKWHYARCPALELFCNSLCGPLPKILESPGLYESDRQSSTRQRGGLCWELQDESFAFICFLRMNWYCMRGSSQQRSSARIWSIFCCVRSSRNENQR